MRRLFLIAPLLMLIGGCLWAVIAGLDMRLAAHAAGWQREFQTGLASSLRALRAGESGASAVMLGLCFGYGFVHAVGPGHGKLLIGGYGLGRDVPFLRLSAISVLSALGQAATAVALVGGGLLSLGWTRQRLTGIAETTMLPLSTLAIGLVGVWLILRGTRRLWHLRTSAPARPGDTCGCRHKHGPSPEDMTRGTGLSETLALVASIAIRPCSGAILLLILTWYMDILTIGLLGTVAMSLGTATLTVGVAAISVFARRTTVLSFGHGTRAQVALPIFEVVIGLLVAGISIELIGIVP